MTLYLAHDHQPCQAVQVGGLERSMILCLPGKPCRPGKGACREDTRIRGPSLPARQTDKQASTGPLPLRRPGPQLHAPGREILPRSHYHPHLSFAHPCFPYCPPEALTCPLCSVWTWGLVWCHGHSRERLSGAQGLAHRDTSRRRSPRNGRTTFVPSLRSTRTFLGPRPFHCTRTVTGFPRSR